MRRPSPLPEVLAQRDSFAVEEGTRAGLSRRRLQASDLHTQFREARIRVGAEPGVAALAAAYAARMPASQFFSHTTSAILNGVPLPFSAERDLRLHVSVFAGDAQPRVRGVVGHQLDAARTATVTAGALRMTDAQTAWCQLAALLDPDDLIAAGDFLISGRGKLGGPGPTATPAMLARAVSLHSGTVGVGRLRGALPQLRSGPLSRRESLLRLRMMRAGLPEPAVAFVVRDPRLAPHEPTVDLAYPEYRVAIEYEGDHHRTTGQFRRDIRRYERLHDIGWAVIRVSAADVPDAPASATDETVRRIAARLRRRGWRG